MTITTLANIDTEVFFIKGSRIASAPVASIGVEISNSRKIVIRYRFGNTTLADLVEEDVALTQEALFEKIKIKNQVKE